jgi:hypothetical protein
MNAASEQNVHAEFGDQIKFNQLHLLADYTNQPYLVASLEYVTQIRRFRVRIQCSNAHTRGFVTLCEVDSTVYAQMIRGLRIPCILHRAAQNRTNHAVVYCSGYGSSDCSLLLL